MNDLTTLLRYLLVALLVYIPDKDAFSQWTQSTTLTGGSIVNDIVEFNGDMYIAVIGSGIHRSADDGDTWQKLSVPAQAASYSFVLHNGELLAIGHSKLFRTSDGNVWSEEDAPTQFIEDVSSDGINIFVATSQGLYQSADAGATWVKNPDPATNVCFSSVVVKGTTIIAGVSFPNPGTVLRSVNGGSTWTSTVISADNKIRDLYFQGTVLYANVHYIGVYKSTDNGANWQLNRSVPTDSRLLATPTSVYSLSNQRVAVSNNGGVSWTENGAATPGYFGVVLYATDSYLFIGSVGGGVFRNNVGANEPWETANTGLLCFDVNDIEVVNNTILAGTENSFIRASIDEGASWSQFIDAYGWPSTSGRVLLSSGSDLFSSDQGGGGIYRSSDNGATWFKKNEGIGNMLISALAKTTTAIALGTDANSENGVYISENRGDTWTKKSYVTNTGVRCLHSDGENIYAGTWSGLFKSSNNFNMWTPISAGLPDQSIGHIVSIGSILYAGTQFNGLYKTANNGVNWELVNNNFVYSLAARKKVLFLGTLDNKFLISLDSGKTWQDKTTGLPNARVTAINFTEANLVVGSEKSGVWLRPLTQLVPPDFSFYSAFPDSTFKIGQPIFVQSDQELRKPDGSIIESSELKSNMTVVDSESVVDFEAIIDDEKKLITITITNAVENKSYWVILEPFKNISGLASTAMFSYPFTAVLNHVPSVGENLVQGPSNETIQFSQAMFINSFSDLDEDDLEKILIKSLPQHGTLKIGSTPVSINDEILIGAVGGLSYSPVENFDGDDQWKWNGSDGKSYAAKDATVNIKVNAITGVPESTSHNFKLYPNPVSEIATIDVPDNFTEGGIVRVFDLTGREIKKLNFSNDSRSLDFSDISKGVYILKVSIHGKNFEQKVVKL
jgi:hypothetical protein